MKKISLLLALAIVLSLCLCGCTNSEKDKVSTDYSQAKSLADFKGAKIGAQPGTVFEEIAVQIEDVQLETGYLDVPDLIVALKAGAVDGVILERPQSVSAANQNDELTFVDLVNNDTGFTVSEESAGIAIGLKKGSELTKEINEALAEISEEERNELMTAFTSIASGATYTNLNIKTDPVGEYKGTLKVGMECGSMPWNWTVFEELPGSVQISGEGKEGQYAVGYDVVISQYIADKLGYKLEIYAYTWDNLIPAVEAGTLDLIIAGMSPTAERKEVIDFTDLYFEVQYTMLVRKAED